MLGLKKSSYFPVSLHSPLCSSLTHAHIHTQKKELVSVLISKDFCLASIRSQKATIALGWRVVWIPHLVLFRSVLVLFLLFLLDLSELNNKNKLLKQTSQGSTVN